ncbi:acyl-CoA dehydrogenase family protein [Amycolatopsis jejuensis]|uniref:acyl-CoA dehydrogenase family protein n=1 Tax=Amycolatopsis jejuensis TaxID=330084 RepID=UPI00068A878F|nr:acyl-CoA dehydrogenase family protein [Amycolatopsis jejuensis]
MNAALLRPTGTDRLLAEIADAVAHQAGYAQPEGFDQVKGWRRAAEAGLCGMRLPERFGGGGCSAVDLVTVATSLGTHLAVLPLLGHVLAGELATLAGATAETLTGLADGTLRLTVGLSADLTGTGEAVAWDAAGADAALVPADGKLVARAVAEPSGRPADLTRTVTPLGPAVDVGDLGGELGDLRRWTALALTLVAADTVGAMAGALGAAVEYSRTRVQFGAPIGSFQALQHLCADAYVSLTAAQALTSHAAEQLDTADPAAALLAARSANALAAEYGRPVAEAAMQVFGGMGITWELPQHAYLRRIALNRRVLGDERYQYTKIAESRLEA